MRITICLLSLLALVAVTAGQDGEGEGATAAGPYANERYQVKVTPPSGWRQTVKGPKPEGGWIKLVEYTEPRTEATLSLSASATHHRDPDSLIAAMKSQFQKSTELAVLQQEEQGETAKRSKGILFEYTTLHQGKAQHAVAAYYMHAGNRFRILGLVKEVGWRSVGEAMKEFARGLEFTSRIYSKDQQNYRDEIGNFALYFPEDWTITVPASGPRIAFASQRLGIAFWVYVSGARGSTLEENVTKHLDVLGDGAKILERGSPRMHSSLSTKTVTLTYSKTEGGRTLKYRELLVLHRENFYRFVLAAQEAAFDGGLPSYEMVLSTLAFLR
jgi:hypothetical protein